VSPQQGTREIKHIRKIINVWKSKGLKMLPCETPIEHTRDCDVTEPIEICHLSLI